MRRQYFYWTYLVLCFVFIIYGGYNLIYNFNHGKGLSIISLVMLIIGSVLLIIYLILFLITYLNKKKRVKQDDRVIEEESLIEEKRKEPKPVEEEKKSEPEPVKKTAPRDEAIYERSPRPQSRYDIDWASGYVLLVGYGPVLRLSENRILDMRNNTYYRIEGNIVKQEGSGPVFEINGRKIRSAFGGYLYEISGSNVNKVFGGFYASFSGNYLTTYDSKEKYEVPGSMTIQQQLAVVALLFGAY